MSRADVRRAQYRNVLQGQGGLFGKTGYGSQFGFDARGLDRLSQTDYIRDPSKYIFSDSAYAPTNEYESAGFTARGYIGSGRGARQGNIYMFQKKKPVTPTTITEYRDNPEQAKKIAELSEQLKLLSESNTGYEESIKNLMGQIASNKTAFDTQLSEAQTAADERIASLTDQFKIDMDAAAAASQTQLDDLMAANQAALLAEREGFRAEREGFRSDLAARDQQYRSELDRRDLAQQRRDEAAKLARAAEAERMEQMRIGQETAAANAARSGQSAQFQLGSGGSAPSLSGGIGQFKRRFKINPVTARGLSIAANRKTTNKMLNV